MRWRVASIIPQQVRGMQRKPGEKRERIDGTPSPRTLARDGVLLEGGKPLDTVPISCANGVCRMLLHVSDFNDLPADLSKLRLLPPQPTT
jgi:hypothetical protein